MVQQTNRILLQQFCVERGGHFHLLKGNKAHAVTHKKTALQKPRGDLLILTRPVRLFIGFLFPAGAFQKKKIFHNQQTPTTSIFYYNKKYKMFQWVLHVNTNIIAFFAHHQRKKRKALRLLYKNGKMTTLK